MFPMLSGLFSRGVNGWVVLAHKTISVPLRVQVDSLYYALSIQIKMTLSIQINIKIFYSILLYYKET